MRRIAVFLVSFVVVTVGITGFFISVTVRAFTVPSWTNSLPTMIHNTPVTTGLGNPCTGVFQDLEIMELHASKRVCGYGDDHLMLGYFSVGGPNQAVVRLPYSHDTHILSGVCAVMICRYSADADVLVTQQFIGQYSVGLVMFKNVSKRIHRIESGGAFRYEFDTTRPDYEIKNDLGRYLWTPSIAISDNGQWIVAELRNAGLVLINTDSLLTRHIMTSGYTYDNGTDPVEQLAVSNDGKSVALTGLNAGFRIIDSAPGCGQPLVDDLRQLPSAVRCSTTDFAIGTSFPNFRSAEQPRFIGNGQQFEVIVNSWVGGSRRLMYVADGAQEVHQLKLLSLGDSFTSGEGETDPYYYETGTAETFDNCHVSRRSYPYLLASALGISSADAKSVACSGARTNDIVGGSDSYWGQGGRLGREGLSLSVAEKTAAQELALTNVRPGRSLQATFLERYNPEVITIGVGGNNAGLMGKVKDCAMLGTCEWVRAEGLRATANEIKGLFDTLGSVFSHISKTNPDGTVYVVGYPNVIDPSGTCDPATGLLLNYSERVFIEKSIEYLNQVIHAAAQRAGFTYLDVEHSMTDNRLCGVHGADAVNGLRFGGDISLLSAIPMLKIISAGTFHPTPRGHALMSNAILASHPGFLYSNNCAATPLACMAPGLSIEPPEYWGVRLETNDRASYVTDFTGGTVPDSHQLKVVLPVGTFEDRSIVRAEIHSETQLLKTFSSHDDGGIDETVVIPSDIEAGFHTIHLLGTNREGRLVDLYQFIIIGNDANVLSVSSDGGSSYVATTVSSRMGVTAVSELPVGKAVLGVEATASNNSVTVNEVTLPADASPQSVVKSVKPTLLWSSALIVVVLIASVVFCTIKLRRRWAKPGS